MDTQFECSTRMTPVTQALPHGFTQRRKTVHWTTSAGSKSKSVRTSTVHLTLGIAQTSPLRARSFQLVILHMQPFSIIFATAVHGNHPAHAQCHAALASLGADSTATRPTSSPPSLSCQFMLRKTDRAEVSILRARVRWQYQSFTVPSKSSWPQLARYRNNSRISSRKPFPEVSRSRDVSPRPPCSKPTCPSPK